MIVPEVLARSARLFISTGSPCVAVGSLSQTFTGIDDPKPKCLVRQANRGHFRLEGHDLEFAKMHWQLRDAKNRFGELVECARREGAAVPRRARPTRGGRRLGRDL
jgi:hypothetical protein